MPFEITETEIPDVVVVKAVQFQDDRGYFMETYKEADFDCFLKGRRIVQRNRSKSHIGVLRGLHFQIGDAVQGKLVEVVRGSIIDVAVDLRAGSPTFGKYVKRKLTDENNEMLWVPPGFAHGFLSIADETLVSYGVTSPYSREHERGLKFDDPAVNIDWGWAKDISPMVHERDLAFPCLDQCMSYFTY